MNSYTSLIEQSSCYKRLLADISAGNVSHAYMLYGEDSVAIEAAAFNFALKIAKRPDIIFVPKEADSDKVKTEDINGLTDDCYLRPWSGEYKVYIIKNAHTMTDQAQNKLLKTLEEPPAGVVIALCAAVPAKLLSTVHSRCRKIPMPPFTSDALYGYLTGKGVSAAEASLAAVYGGGSVTKAERILADARYGAALGLIFDMFKGMKRSPDILLYAQKLAQYKDIAQDILDFILIAARDILAAAEGKKELIFTKRREDDIIELTAGYSAASCAAVIEKIGYAKKRLYYNCNYQGVIDELLFSILEVKTLYA